MADARRDVSRAGSGAGVVRDSRLGTRDSRLARRTFVRGGYGRGTLCGRLSSAGVIAATTLAACSSDRLQGPDPAGSAAAGVLEEQPQAEPVDLTCVGTNDATFSPGLRFTTQTVDIEAEGEYTGCTGSDPAVTSGSYTASGEGTMSCLAGGHAGEFTITWNTGEYSTIEFTNSVALRPGGQTVVVATGTVIDGKFLGDRFDGTFTLFQLDVLACLSPQGVTSATGPTTLLLTAL